VIFDVAGAAGASAHTLGTSAATRTEVVAMMNLRRHDTGEP
jgi:hypothetical protein